MKHIKGYKIFESGESSKSTDIVEYLKDIFQELTDIGFEIQTFKNALGEITVMCKYLPTKGTDYDFATFIPFYYNQIKDYVDSCIDYMESEGYKINRIKVRNYFSSIFKEIEKSDLDNLEQTAYIKLFFIEEDRKKFIYNKYKDSRPFSVLTTVLEKSSESQEEIAKYLRDIFRELEDKGLFVKVYDTDSTKHLLHPMPKDRIEVSIAEPVNLLFKFGVISEYIISATEYMESVGWKRDTIIPYEDWQVIKGIWLTYRSV